MVYYYNEDIGEHIEYDGKGGRSMDGFYLKDILKQADTIEELCDELVLIEEDYPIIIEELNFKEGTYLRNNEYEFLSKLPENPNIYGAIWVNGEYNEPILKSVSKMNEKGELELL